MQLPEEVMLTFTEAEKLFAEGDIDGAINRIDASLPSLEGDILEADALNNKGYYLLHQAKWQEAIHSFEKAFMIDPSFHAVSNHLAWAALMIGNWEGAEALMNLFETKQADYQALHLRNQALIHTMEGNKFEAIELLQSAKEEDPYMAYVDLLLQVNGELQGEEIVYPASDLQFKHLNSILNSSDHLK